MRIEHHQFYQTSGQHHNYPSFEEVIATISKIIHLNLVGTSDVVDCVDDIVNNSFTIVEIARFIASLNLLFRLFVEDERNKNTVNSSEYVNSSSN
jgi:hypothetical protein